MEFGIKPASFSTDGSRGKSFVEKTIKFVRETPEFNVIWMSDHFIPWPSDHPNVPLNADLYECWTLSSYLAGAFPNRKIGQCVMANSYRNPALVAKMAATLDALSGGRLILGLGAGRLEEEYHQYGYEFPSAAVRIKQLEEAVQIIRKMWTEDKVTFKGRYFHIQNATAHPQPDTCPPILIAGAGEKRTLRIVAKYADWWNMSAKSLEDYEHKLKVLAEHCVKVGRDFDEIRKTCEFHVAIGETKEQAEDIILKGNKAQLVGTPEEVVDYLTGFINLGVDYCMVRFTDEPSTTGARIFAEKVIPKLN